MSFQSYLNNIETKTGKAPSDFMELAEAKGFIENDTIKEGIKAKIAKLSNVDVVEVLRITESTE